MEISSNKYKNVKTTINGISFSSKMEAKVYEVLLSLKEKNIISNLILQPKFVLNESFRRIYYDSRKEKINTNQIREITYISDFSFIYKEKNFILEVKGMMDQKYPIKKKLFLSKYPEILFLEIRRIRELNKIIEILDNLIMQVTQN